MTPKPESIPELIENYLSSGKRGKSFTKDTAERKKGNIKNFLAYAGENGYRMETLLMPPTKGTVATGEQKVRILPVDPNDFVRKETPKYTETRPKFTTKTKIHKQ